METSVMSYVFTEQTRTTWLHLYILQVHASKSEWNWIFGGYIDLRKSGQELYVLQAAAGHPNLSALLGISEGMALTKNVETLILFSYSDLFKVLFFFTWKSIIKPPFGACILLLFAWNHGCHHCHPLFRGELLSWAGLYCEGPRRRTAVTRLELGSFLMVCWWWWCQTLIVKMTYMT